MQKLKDLTITKIALVPEGDNKGAECLLFKRKPPDPEPEAAEETLLKKMLVALGKALGFDNPSPPPANSTGGGNQAPNEITKGEIEDMKIDKSKLTPEELQALTDIEKKAGIPEDGADADVNKDKDADANKGKDAQDVNKDKDGAGTGADTDGGDDIYKGIHPVIKAELERLRKQADAAEDRELAGIAKKYEIIGKKPEELVPILKSLKAAGDETYNQMIAIMDGSVAAIEKSGIFNELGKRGNGESSITKTIDGHAAEILKANPDLNWHQASAKAWDAHPELLEEYEQSRQ